MSEQALDPAQPIDPEISVVIIFYNGIAFIGEAVASVFEQTHQRWELLLVDDGSTDGSGDYARRLAIEHSARVRYLQHLDQGNHGTSATRNLGLCEARGEFLIRLDCDDVFATPTALAEQAQLLRSHPGVAMVYGPCQYWNSWQGGADHLQKLRYSEKTAAPAELVAAIFHPGDDEPISMMLRTQDVRDCGGWEEDIRDFGEDFILSLKLLLNRSVYVSDRCWYRYRTHPDSYSQSVIVQGTRDARETELLDWVKRYLKSRAVRDDAIWKAFNQRRRPLRHRRLLRLLGKVASALAWRGWRLRVLINKAIRKVRGGASGVLRVDAHTSRPAAAEAPFRATVRWNARGAGSLQVRVGGPEGIVFVSTADPAGESDTHDWVQEGMLFFLQQGDARKPATAAATLDIVRAQRGAIPGTAPDQSSIGAKS